MISDEIIPWAMIRIFRLGSLTKRETQIIPWAMIIILQIRRSYQTRNSYWVSATNEITPFCSESDRYERSSKKFLHQFSSESCGGLRNLIRFV